MSGVPPNRWERARAVGDAVLYEGYLLYPYRADSGKNRARWQFGVLGPTGAESAGIGENPGLAAELLVRTPGKATLSGVVRFLQLQHRSAEREYPPGTFEPVEELVSGSGSWLSWDEAVECEVGFGPVPLSEGTGTQTISVPGGSDIETVEGGRLRRTRRPLHAALDIAVRPDDALLRVGVCLYNTAGPAADATSAIATSLIGTHVIAELHGGEFISLLEPDAEAVDAAGRCRQHRCFPVLAGPPGDTTVVLISPIILYDHPEIAAQSSGALFDSTEIDEILTLRVITMTDEEKARARATDPLAAQIIDRCDAMSPEEMLNLHGVLRDPRAGPIPAVPDPLDWWDPLVDNNVHPETDALTVGGTRIARGSRVRLRPSRRADAQDLFFAGRIAKVTSVHEDVDGNRHVGVVIEDDPGADLHDSYGRYLYFGPEEIEPLTEGSTQCRQ